MPTTTLTLISSMATKALLADLVAEYTRLNPDVSVVVTSVGGVDAAKRVVAGEAFDIVALASDAIEKLAARGHVTDGSRINIVRSAVAVAIPAGTPLPDISTEASLKAAVLAAPTLGYSTGPSGVQLARLFERWGIAESHPAAHRHPAAGRVRRFAGRQRRGCAGFPAAERDDGCGGHRGDRRPARGGADRDHVFGSARHGQ